MSDYLWDKTGEPDAEVERLESLLGALRHRPRELELPPAPPARADRANFGLFKIAALAAAAALAVAALAGALVASRDSVGGETPPVAASHPSGVGAPRGGGNAANPAPSNSPSAAADGENLPPVEVSEAGAPPRSHASRRAGRRSPSSKARPRGVGAPESAGGGSTEVAAFPESRGAEAKEQLLYALRLASAQLEDVRRKTQDAGGGQEADGPRGRVR